MPIESAVHARTLQLCESLNYRDWSGYYAVSAYESHHDYEYSAIRNGAALIDISPLYKYLIKGPDAERLVNRVITRDVTKLKVGQVTYTTWCDEFGKVIDDGTVSKLAEDRYRWTAADPNLLWFQRNSRGLNVSIEDISQEMAALAIQGPMSAKVLGRLSDCDLQNLKYFRVLSTTLANISVDVSRTGYTGDLGYELWMQWKDAVKVWDAVIGLKSSFGVRPVGMLALDVARIEAGLLLTDVDFISSRKALTSSQSYSPFEMGLGRLVSLDKECFVGQTALRNEYRRGSTRQIVGLEVDWAQIERLYDRAQLPAEPPMVASREAVPIYNNNVQIGKVTSMTWSPALKKLIALGTLAKSSCEQGNRVQVEYTIDAVRYKVNATVAKTPFFNPPRKISTSPIEDPN